MLSNSGPLTLWRASSCIVCLMHDARDDHTVGALQVETCVESVSPKYAGTTWTFLHCNTKKNIKGFCRINFPRSIVCWFRTNEFSSPHIRRNQDPKALTGQLPFNSCNALRSRNDYSFHHRFFDP